MSEKERNHEDRNQDPASSKRWESIRAKCHPAMFDLAQLWKELIETLNQAGPNPSSEVIAEINAGLEKRTVEINARYLDLAQFNSDAFVSQSIFSELAFVVDHEDPTGVIEWLHFGRHKIPMKQDVESMRNGDWSASRRVQRTFADVEYLRCQKKPIKPFKGNLEHSNMFETFWGLGLEKLTVQELADFFDRYCPCNVDTHDPDALKKHRARYQKSVNSSAKLPQ